LSGAGHCRPGHVEKGSLFRLELEDFAELCRIAAFFLTAGVRAGGKP